MTQTALRRDPAPTDTEKRGQTTRTRVPPGERSRASPGGRAAEAAPRVGTDARGGRSSGAGSALEGPAPHLSAKRRRPGLAPERQVNCVLVGDGAVGKTSLVVSYTTNGYPVHYVPTALDNFSVMVLVDDRPVRLQLCDTAGRKWGLGDGSIHDELERLRPLCYKNADVFLLCYSVVRPCSFHNLLRRWVPEVRRHRPGAPLVLVGTQLDLREDVQVLIHLAHGQQRPVGTEEGRRLAQELGAVGFAECSALTQKNLKDAFDSAVLAGVQQTDDCGVQQQRLAPRMKTPDTGKKNLSETWWRKINCLMGEQSCDFQ